MTNLPLVRALALFLAGSDSKLVRSSFTFHLECDYPDAMELFSSTVFPFLSPVFLLKKKKRHSQHIHHAIQLVNCLAEINQSAFMDSCYQTVTTKRDHKSILVIVRIVDSLPFLSWSPLFHQLFVFLAPILSRPSLLVHQTIDSFFRFLSFEKGTNIIYDNRHLIDLAFKAMESWTTRFSQLFRKGISFLRHFLRDLSKYTDSQTSSPDVGKFLFALSIRNCWLRRKKPLELSHLKVLFTFHGNNDDHDLHLYFRLYYLRKVFILLCFQVDIEKDTIISLLHSYFLTPPSIFQNSTDLIASTLLHYSCVTPDDFLPFFSTFHPQAQNYLCSVILYQDPQLQLLPKFFIRCIDFHHPPSTSHFTLLHFLMERTNICTDENEENKNSAAVYEWLATNIERVFPLFETPSFHPHLTLLFSSCPAAFTYTWPPLFRYYIDHHLRDGHPKIEASLVTLCTGVTIPTVLKSFIDLVHDHNLSEKVPLLCEKILKKSFCSVSKPELARTLILLYLNFSQTDTAEQQRISLKLITFFLPILHSHLSLIFPLLTNNLKKMPTPPSVPSESFLLKQVAPFALLQILLTDIDPDFKDSSDLFSFIIEKFLFIRPPHTHQAEMATIVRKMAAQCLALFPPELLFPVLHTHLTVDSVANTYNFTTNITLTLFILCHVIMRHRHIDKVLTLLPSILCLIRNEADERILEGAVDTLSLLLAEEIRNSDSSFLRLLCTHFSLTSSPSSPPQNPLYQALLSVPSLFVFAVLQGCIKHITSTNDGGLPEHGNILPQLLFLFDNVKTLASSFSNMDVPLQKAFLELIFALTFSLSNTPSNLEVIINSSLLHVAATSLNSSDPQLRFLALKLVGSLLATLSNFPRHSKELKWILDMKIVLENITLQDTDHNCRDLASNLSSLMG